MKTALALLIVVEAVLILAAIYAAWMAHLSGRAAKAWRVVLDWNRQAQAALTAPVPPGEALANAQPLIEAEREAAEVARTASDRVDRWDVFSIGERLEGAE